ncbi:hypothetical protein [Aphanizomenon flos-aquae]|uniref:Uncharacterized protein n=1 Tax=Aphanizomenon flos-aquae FACHB-1040 TaxID=2692887 RepID=A0ABR8BRY5_APHFL|nr:hypothetical protein [Aphanizomenon flos-aquae]MBD2277366.1 hypothetical protein [Aphanizomenon flos-aquae FACHB-1040]
MWISLGGIGSSFLCSSLRCCDRLGFPQELGAIASLNNLVGAIARINHRILHPVNPDSDN